CGPGAIRDGRFVASDSTTLYGLASNRRGDMARIQDGQVVWLASDFTITDPQSFDAAPGTYDPEASGIQLADDGAAYASVRGDNDFGFDTSFVALDSRHAQRWRLEVGSLDDYEGYGLAGDSDLAVITGQRLNLSANEPVVMTGDVVALEGSTGAVRWRRRFPQPDQDQQVVLGLAPDGGPVIVAGSFNNSLDLGGSVGMLHAAGSFDAFVAGLDRTTGETLWATQFSVDHFVIARVNHLVVGPAGELAMNIGWETTIGHDSGPAAGMLTIGTRTVAPQAELSRAIALLGPTGELQWVQQSEDLISLVTDGSRVFGGARGVLSGLSAVGLDWRRPVTGPGFHVGSVSGLIGDRLVGTISSLPDVDGAFAPAVDGDVTIAGRGVAFVELVH
ncbi:MAG: hypothetical protein ABI678_28715, partial [Kofleriaceae bacterium]